MVARGLPMPRELCSGAGTSGGPEVAEVVDLMDNEDPIDVDTFIIEVLFVKEVSVKKEQEKPTDSQVSLPALHACDT